MFKKDIYSITFVKICNCFRLMTLVLKMSHIRNYWNNFISQSFLLILFNKIQMWLPSIPLILQFIQMSFILVLFFDSSAYYYLAFISSFASGGAPKPVYQITCCSINNCQDQEPTTCLFLQNELHIIFFPRNQFFSPYRKSRLHEKLLPMEMVSRARQILFKNSSKNGLISV